MRTENTKPLKILYLSAYICVITGSYLIYFGDTEFVFVKAMNSKIQMAILFSIVLVLIFYFRWREIYTSPDYKKKFRTLILFLLFLYPLGMIGLLIATNIHLNYRQGEEVPVLIIEKKEVNRRRSKKRMTLRNNEYYLYLKSSSADASIKSIRVSEETYKSVDIGNQIPLIHYDGFLRIPYFSVQKLQ